MQFKYRNNRILNQLDLSNLMFNYHPTSHLIEVGFKHNALYQSQLNLFNYYNLHQSLILKDYSERYGIVSESQKLMASNVFC